MGVRKATPIETFHFSTLHTFIPHDLLKSRMNVIINNAFKHKNGATRYTHIKVGINKCYFTNDPLRLRFPILVIKYAKKVDNRVGATERNIKRKPKVVER